jgi:hypothetical protein
LVHFKEPDFATAFANNQEMIKTIDGCFKKKIKIAQNKGTYKIPIVIKYKDENTGVNKSVSKTIEYKVE